MQSGSTVFCIILFFRGPAKSRRLCRRGDSGRAAPFSAMLSLRPQRVCTSAVPTISSTFHERRSQALCEPRTRAHSHSTLNATPIASVRGERLGISASSRYNYWVPLREIQRPRELSWNGTRLVKLERHQPGVYASRNGAVKPALGYGSTVWVVAWVGGLLLLRGAGGSPPVAAAVGFSLWLS